MHPLRSMRLTVVCLGVSLFAARVEARNIDLSTVPRRDTVQLTIYNSEDLTLVRETRAVTFKKGSNPLEFSWAGTRIDPTSVELKFVSHAHELTVLDTTYPHDRPQVLYWNVQSEFDGEATIEITYFTSGITWSSDYQCVADAQEQQLQLDAFVRVINNSGEDYEGARIRLVVGTINLVEKIAVLANIPVKKVAEMEKDERWMLRNSAARSMLEAKDGAASAPRDEKEIIKEGLSEYFIYTIEGTETIRNGWSKRMRSLRSVTVPLAVQYRYRPEEYGDRLVRMYLLTNDTHSKLGTTPLPDGMVRVFRANGRGGLSYVAEQQIKYVPIGDRIELNLGVDPEVVFELRKLRLTRDNLWLQLRGVDVLKRVDRNELRIEPNASVVGWDDHESYSQRVRNYTRRPINVEIRRSFDGDVHFRSRLNPKRHDYRTVELQTSVAPGAKAELAFEIVRHQGRSARQRRVELVDADVQH